MRKSMGKFHIEVCSAVSHTEEQYQILCEYIYITANLFLSEYYTK